MANKKPNKIPVWAIVLGFMFGFWPGAIMLVVRILQDKAEKDNTAPTQPKSAQRPVQPPRQQTASVVRGGMNADGTYRYYTPPQPDLKRKPQPTSKPQPTLLQHKSLHPKRGKGLKLAGSILLGFGAVVAGMAFFSELYYGLEWLWDAITIAAQVALPLCTPGAVMAVVGDRKNDRVLRCRTYATIIGNRRRVDIDELAAAIPIHYNKCVEDLQWMLGEGLLQGMYIDGTNRVLTYPQAEAAPKAAEPPKKPLRTADGDFPEAARIHALNVDIQDDYVSRRMDRLEELTRKILAYAQEHPEKEPSLRQFRNHYLPKTLSILESYARMERMGVAGGNIGSAMKDVEDIMDKLVQGFEKQLDTLFDSEALDVTTDVSVLENMMTLEGLSDLDPFGTVNRRDAGETWTKQ